MRTDNYTEKELQNFVINHGKSDPAEKVEQWVQRSQLGFFTGAFGFFTTPKNEYLLMVKPELLHLPLQVFVFPIAAILEIAEATTALVLLVRSKNKNLGKTLDLLSKIQKAGIIVTAVALAVLSVATGVVALGVAVPYLFLVGLGLHALYQTGQLFWSIRKFRQLPKGSALRETYRQRITVTGIRSGIGLIVTAVIGVLFVAAISSGVGLAIAAGIGIATMITGLLIGFVLARRAEKQAKQAALRGKTDSKSLSPQQKEIQDKIKTALAENAAPEVIYEATITDASEHADDYYYVRNLPRLLDAAKKQGGMEKLKVVFGKIIQHKIEKLNHQISSVDLDDWHRRFNLSENKKREQKVDALKALKTCTEKVVSDEALLDDKEVQAIIDKYPKLFQSFFKNKDDVENILDAAREYFVKRPPVVAKKPSVGLFSQIRRSFVGMKKSERSKYAATLTF